MKKIALVLTALVLSAGLRAEEAKSAYSITTDFTYTSEYIFRGLEQQDKAYQPSVTFVYGGLSLGVWTSQAANNKSLTWANGNEVDFFGSYAFTIDKYTLSVGGTYYDYPSARKALGEPSSSYESSIALSAPLFSVVSGTATYYHDFKLKSDTLQIGLNASIPTGIDKTTFDFGAYIGTSDIADANGSIAGSGGIKYNYFGADATWGYKLTDSLTFKAAAHYADVSGSDVNTWAPANLWYTVSLTASF